MFKAKSKSETPSFNRAKHENPQKQADRFKEIVKNRSFTTKMKNLISSGAPAEEEIVIVIEENPALRLPDVFKADVSFKQPQSMTDNQILRNGPTFEAMNSYHLHQHIHHHHTYIYPSREPAKEAYQNNSEKEFQHFIENKSNMDSLKKKILEHIESSNFYTPNAYPFEHHFRDEPPAESKPGDPSERKQLSRRNSMQTITDVQLNK
jgi:hypothetical protein